MKFTSATNFLIAVGSIVARLPSTTGQLRGGDNNYEIDEDLLQEKLQELKLNFGFKVPIFSDGANGEGGSAGWPSREDERRNVGNADGASPAQRRTNIFEGSSRADLQSGYSFTPCTGTSAGPACGEVIANYSAGERDATLISCR